MDPVRPEPPLVAATVKPTVPLPVPDAPLTIVSHGSLAVAVHAHDGAEAVTATDPDPPVSGKRWPLGAIEKVHGGGGGGGAA